MGAVGLLVEQVAKRKYKDSTLIFVVEDDAQNGGDHMDAHRSIALVAGPFVKQRALVSRHYTAVSMIRTIADVVGIEPLGLNDALAEPMAEIFHPYATGLVIRSGSSQRAVYDPVTSAPESVGVDPGWRLDAAPNTGRG